MATYSFSGRRVLVTGGANGVGKTIVKSFLKSGATVIAVDVDSKGLEILKEEFPEETLVTLTLDLSNWKVTQEVITQVFPIHHLINNAGIVIPKHVLDVTEQDIDAMVAVNYKAAFNLSQIFARNVKSQNLGGGTIVHISSVIDQFNPPNYSAYSGTKAALASLSRSLAAELGDLNIRSNVVRPDLMPTGMVKRQEVTDPEGMQKLLNYNIERSAIKRLVDPSDLCGLILFLSSSDSSMITGVAIPVDGGFSLT